MADRMTKWATGLTAASAVVNLSSIYFSVQTVKNLEKAEAIRGANHTQPENMTHVWEKRFGIPNLDGVNQFVSSSDAYAVASVLTDYVASVPPSEWRRNGENTYDWGTMKSVTIKGCEFEWRKGDNPEVIVLRPGEIQVSKADVVFFRPNSSCEIQLIGDGLKYLIEGLQKEH